MKDLFDIMVSIDTEIDETWLRPKEGYNVDEDLNPDDSVNFGIMAYDRLLSSVDDDEIFPVIEKVMQVAMSSEDWRFRNAGLMSIGQIGEYSDSTDKVKNVVPILISHLASCTSKSKICCFIFNWIAFR